MPRAYASFHYPAVSLLAVLANTLIERSRADPETDTGVSIWPEGALAENNECEHIRESGGSWIHDPHWFPTHNGKIGDDELEDEANQQGEGCQGGLMYMCEPQWSAEAHPEDVGNGWSIPMFLDQMSYNPGDNVTFNCNDQSATTRGGLTSGVLGKFIGDVTWMCTKEGWRYKGMCQRARYCRARKGEIKLAPSRSLEETSLALIRVHLEVHELMRYETQWFPCDSCTAHDVASKQDIRGCEGKVLVRCDENDEVMEVDNLCTPAHGHSLLHKRSHSLVEMNKSNVPLERPSKKPYSRDFLHGQPATKKAHSEDAAGRAPRANRRHEA